MNRGRRAFIATALLLIAVLGGAALVFRQAVRECWLIWRLEHGNAEQANKAAGELGRMGSLRAIRPLTARMDASQPAPWSPWTAPHPLVGVLSALHRIARTRREESLPYLSVREDMSQTCKDTLHQLAQVARREKEVLELSLPYGLRSHSVVIRTGERQANPQADESLLPLLPGGE